MKVAVIGDSCMDEFVYVDAERLAPDLPIPVVTNRATQHNPGMAANVARNIEFHGIDVQLVTPFDWESVTKTRIVDRRTNHTFLRIDKPFTSEVFDPRSINLDSFDALVISDYVKGFLSAQLIADLALAHDLVFLDTKRPLGRWAEECSFIKVNEHEFKASESGMSDRLLEKTICTLGAKGAVFGGETYPVTEVEVRDTSGAGDSFLARLVAEILKGESVEEAIRCANESASAVVKVRGVGVA